MCYSNRLSSALVLMGALVIGAAPVWAQTGSGSSGGSDAADRGSSSGGYSGQSGGSKSQSGSYGQSGTSSDQGLTQGSQGTEGSSRSRSGSQSSSSGMSSSSDTSSSGMPSSRSSGATAGSENVKRVQQALKDQGQDPGPIDGIIGPKTKEALRAFQQQQGLSATGTLDNPTKQKLGISDSGSSSSSVRGSSSRSSSGGNQ